MATSPLSKEIQKLCRILLYEDGAGLSDGQLLERFVEHQDEAAFAAIVRRHSALVWGLCRRVVGHHHDAEDAFQATFLVLARKAVSVRPGDMLANWLYGVAHRTALKAKALASKRRAREKQVRDMPEAQTQPQATWRDLEPLIDQELAQLPDKYRIAILLCDLEGKTGKEAARLLKIPEGTLTSRLTRGRAMLAKRLARHGVIAPAGTVASLLAQSASSACVPAALVAATAKTAFLAAAGQTAAISATVAALTEGVMKAMLISKLKTAMVVVLLLSMVGAGAGVSMHSALAPPLAIAEPQRAAKPDIDAANALAGQAVVIAQDGEASKKVAPRLDLYGDPLPEGAIARMGSLRLRHAGLSDFVFLPDGQTVLSAGRDWVLRFWDVGSGKQVREVRLQGVTGPGKYVRLSPDGKLAVTKDGKRLVVWEVDSGKDLKTLAAPRGEIQYLCFSPDGKTLAVGRASDWRASLYDWQTGKERDVALPLDPRQIRQGTSSDFHGSFSPDSKWFVAGASPSDTLGIFEAATGREVRRLDCFAAMSTVSPDSRRLAVFSQRNNKGESAVVIRLFDLASGKELAQFPFDAEYWFLSLAFSPDGKTLACSFSDRSCLLDLATGRILYHLPDRPNYLAFSPDGKMLMAQADWRLRIWDAATGKERHDRPGDFGYPPVLGVSPDGQRLAARTWMGKTVMIWDTRDGRLLQELPLKTEQNYVQNLAYTSDGKTLIASQERGFVRYWDAANGKEVQSLQLIDPDEPTKNAVFYQQVHRAIDGKHFSTLGYDYRIGSKSAELALWESTTGKLIRRHWLPREGYYGAWLSDGTSIAVPLKEGLTLLDVRSGLPRFRVPGVATAVPLAVSPDDRLLVAVRIGAKNVPIAVGVWEVISGKEVATVATGGVKHLALAPDNRSLVTTNERFLQVWDLATGKERTRWLQPVAGTDSESLLLSSDGRRAFTANADGTALVWDLAPALHTAVPLVGKAGANELAGWWADLAGDAGLGYAAIWRLSELKGDAAVAMLRQKLKPVADVDFQTVRMHIKDLASSSFKVRENARMELEKLGSAAAPALRQALETTQPIEVRRRLEHLLSLSSTHTPETLRQLRAIQVLERMASKDARRLLTELASGMPYASQTQEAKTAVERLARSALQP